VLERVKQGDDWWEVSRVIDVKTEGGVTFYKVLWKNFSRASAQWIPESDLSCPALIDEFRSVYGSLDSAVLTSPLTNPLRLAPDIPGVLSFPLMCVPSPFTLDISFPAGCLLPDPSDSP
jgi:hypothetical protein